LYSCYLDPENCTNSGCKFIYKWKSNGLNLTDFIIAGSLGLIVNNWIAIGFSTDNRMVLFFYIFVVKKHFLKLIIRVWTMLWLVKQTMMFYIYVI
jgi:hypothetical protein